MDKPSTQTTAVVTALEIMRSEQPWSGASPENVAAVILMRRGIRFRPSVAPTLEDILPPCRINRASDNGDLTVWQGPQEIPGTIGAPILKPSPIKRAYTQEELDAAVMAERERCAWLASNAMQGLIDAIKNGDQPDRTE
jgi:hypothetical protein